jgi:hypothetical protein
MAVPAGKLAALRMTSAVPQPSAVANIICAHHTWLLRAVAIRHHRG